jgi:predicted nucleic acid-binding protein
VLHLREGKSHLRELLYQTNVLTHPFVIGEVSCGSLRNRQAILGLLNELPRAASAEHEEVLKLIESRRLSSKGIGWVDTHLVASALLSRVLLWTFDQRLRQIASQLKVCYSPAKF